MLVYIFGMTTKRINNYPSNLFVELIAIDTPYDQ